MRVSNLTEKVLKEQSLTRSSDKELHIAVLNEMGACLTEHQKSIIRSYSFESVHRTRRKFQEEGKYLPDDKIIKERYLRSLVAQQNMPTTKPQEVDRFTEPSKAISWLE